MGDIPGLSVGKPPSGRWETGQGHGLGAQAGERLPPTAESLTDLSARSYSRPWRVCKGSLHRERIVRFSYQAPNIAESTISNVHTTLDGPILSGDLFNSAASGWHYEE